jgi:hypothetical protein
MFVARECAERATARQRFKFAACAIQASSPSHPLESAKFMLN